MENIINGERISSFLSGINITKLIKTKSHRLFVHKLDTTLSRSTFRSEQGTLQNWNYYPRYILLGKEVMLRRRGGGGRKRILGLSTLNFYVLYWFQTESKSQWKYSHLNKTLKDNCFCLILILKFSLICFYNCQLPPGLPYIKPKQIVLVNDSLTLSYFWFSCHSSYFPIAKIHVFVTSASY